MYISIPYEISHGLHVLKIAQPGTCAGCTFKRKDREDPQILTETKVFTSE